MLRQGRFRKIGDELGVRLYLVDPATGKSLFDDQAESAYAAALAADFAAHGNVIPGMLRLRLPEAEPTEASAIAVAVPGDAPTALLVEPIGDQMPSPVLLQHVAVGGALELAQLTARQERQRRLGADLLAQILDRRLYGAAAETQLAEFGLGLAGSVLAAASASTIASLPNWTTGSPEPECRTFCCTAIRCCMSSSATQPSTPDC